MNKERAGTRFLVVALFLVVSIAFPQRAGATDDGHSSSSSVPSAKTDSEPGGLTDPAEPPAIIRRINAQINRLVKENERTRRLMEEREHQNQEEVKQLRQQIKAIETSQQQTERKLQVQREASQKQIKSVVKTELAQEAPRTFGGLLDSYWGQHRFVITGGTAATFEYDRNTNINSFAVGFLPVFLWRLSDWAFFQGHLEVGLPASGETEVSLEYAQVDMFLNKYLELGFGKFLLPFGDFIEDVHPPWTNRFISHPVPYREDVGIVPFSDLGLQARGGIQWGVEGQDVDYTAWVGNGPNFDFPLVGSAFADNNISTNTHSKSFGGRLRFYPFPVDSNFGRLELGVSTYDGKWLDGLWFTSWGVDTNYILGNLEVRGAYVETHRQMPEQENADNRQGWYVQAGYQLAGLNISRIIDPFVHRLEPLVRYSGENQRAVIMDPDEPMLPGNGMGVSPSVMVPHPRELALGLDYWIAPSMVWKVEFDMEFPESGGLALTPDGMAMPASTPNDRAIMTQLAVGF
jgi:hypothetical protein